MNFHEQKRSGQWRKFEINNEGVKIDFKIESGHFIQTIRFEEIGFEEQINYPPPLPLRIGLAVSIMFNIMLFVLAVVEYFPSLNKPMGYWSIVFPTSFFLILKLFGRRESLKFITGTKSIGFWYNARFVQEVDKFIEVIKIAKRNYMREKYLTINDYEDSFVIKNRLNWMKSENHISENELTEFLKELEHRKLFRGE